jgi:hypothetical protein
MKQQARSGNPDGLLTTKPLMTTQQPGGCASSLSSSDSDIFHADIKYDSRKYCGKDLKSRGSRRTKKNESRISRTGMNAPRKRSHEEVESERGHKLQKLTNGTLVSQKMVDINGAQSNDKVSSQIEAVAGESDHQELMVSDERACSDSGPESTEIRRQKLSKQMGSHSNNMTQTSSRSASVMCELVKNCAVSCKEAGDLGMLVGAQDGKSVSPLPVKEPNTSEHPAHTEVNNTSVSTFSSASSKDQYKSAVSSPNQEHCKQMHVRGLVPGKENAFRIVTSSDTEENGSLPSTSGQNTSVYQAEDAVKSPHKLQHNGTNGMPITTDKLQRNVTFPLSPQKKNTTICCKRHLSVWLDDLGKAVTERHCTSQKAHDTLGQCLSRQGQEMQEVNETSCNPDSSLIDYGLQSSDDTMDHAMRNLSKAVVHNNLSTEPTKSVPSPAVLDISRRLAVDGASHRGPSISSVTLSSQNEDIREEVATSEDKTSAVNDFLDARNKCLFKILPVEGTGRDNNGGSDGRNVGQCLIQECNRLNSEDHSQVAENSPSSSTVDDPQQLDLVTTLFTYNSHPVQQRLVSDGKSKPQVQDGQHPPSLNNGARLTEDEHCLPPLTSVAEEEELHCEAPHKSLVEGEIANKQLDPVLEINSVLTDSMKPKGQDREHPVISEQSLERDLFARNTPREDNGHQMNEDETYAQFSDAIAARNSVQHCTSTQSSGNQNLNPVVNAGCLEDDEVNDGRSVASDEVPASEVDDLDSADKFSALRRASLTDTELSNKRVGDSVGFNEDPSSDASTECTDSGASLSITVQRRLMSENNESVLLVNDGKEQDEGSYSASVGKCMNEEERTEPSSLELDDGTVEHREMFASGQ